MRITVASLVPTAWPISRADMAPARGPVAKRNSATVRSTGLLRSPDLAVKVPDVVFSSDPGVICSKCYTLRRGWNVKNEGLLFLAIILATAVEMIEALTIVLAVGVTRGWRATLAGVGAAFVVPGLAVATVGPATSHLSFTPLRPVVGGLVLLFGIRWARKATLRTSGYTARHDEDAIYDSTRVSATEAPRGTSFDRYSFTIAFKGVFLEGLGVVFIVLTFGAAEHQLAISAVFASLTVVAVAAVGVLIHRPLSRVPENSLKFICRNTPDVLDVVVGRRSSVSWRGGENAIPVLIAPLAGTSALCAHARQHQHGRTSAPQVMS